METKQKHISARVREKINAAGMRTTSQRAVILDIIKRGHLDAGEIYKMAREKHPGLSLSTVYRMLRKLKEKGMIEELHFDEAHHHYEMRSRSEHFHFMCLKCGEIEELEHEMCRKIKSGIASKSGFEIAGVEMQVFGYCAKCREANG